MKLLIKYQNQCASFDDFFPLQILKNESSLISNSFLRMYFVGKTACYD